MPKIQYKEMRFRSRSLAMIDKANEIIDEYRAQGFDLTLRQLYYQFVARDIIANSQKEYKNLGGIVNDGRLAGLIDWNSIEDRTRNIHEYNHFDGPKAFIEHVYKWYGEDLWYDQDNYVEVWVEKDALIGILGSVCPRNDVPYFSCRGYTSQSEMWGAAQRLISKATEGEGHRETHIIHLGDHDPSGKDMTRDIEDRLGLFMECDEKPATIHRIALNMDQVKKYNPPPNPAKITDSRAAGYIREFGNKSWELDALSPTILSDLIQAQIEALRDEDRWDAAVEKADKNRAKIRAVGKQFKE